MSRFNFDPHGERIALARRRLAAAYTREPGAEVPVVEPGARAPGRGYCFQERFDDLEKMLEHAVAWANGLAATDNDWPPMIDTYVNVAMVAQAFGCEVVCTPGSDPWTRPAIGDISQVWSLRPAPLMDVPMIRRTFEWIDYAQRKLGTDVPVWTMDIQSPFSVAAHVIDGTELLMACVTHPREVHHLCRMITEYTIELMQAHIAQMEHPGFPGRNFPSISENIGICIADDTPLIMLSPEMYRQFALPYNRQLGEVFGGVHIHSCGEYAHNLDNLLAIPSVRSIQVHAGPGEFHLPASPGDDHPFNRARARATCLVDANPIARGDAWKGRPRDHYAEYVLPRLKAGDMTGCILQSCGPGQDLPDVASALAWTRRQVARA